jgi:pyridoxamine--pyruvate transaminase
MIPNGPGATVCSASGPAGPAFNLTGGPSGATAATLAALGRPVPHHLDPAFGALYQRTVDLLQQAFGTWESPVILPGEAVLGLEAVAASLIGPRDVVLNLVTGIYGRGYGEWARGFLLRRHPRGWLCHGGLS